MDPVVDTPLGQEGDRPTPPRRRSARQPEQTLGASDTAPRPSNELVAQRANERYEQRGGDHGHDVEDWLQAERELVDPAPEAAMLTRGRHELAAN